MKNLLSPSRSCMGVGLGKGEMLLIKTMNGTAVNGELMMMLYVAPDKDTAYQAVNAKDDKGWVYTLGLYLSAERAIEEMNKLLDFLAKRNNGMYVMEDYVITGKEKA